MASVKKHFEAKARLEYEKSLADASVKAHYFDLQKKILDLWIDSGMLRSGSIDKTLFVPFYLKLKLGPVDRLDVEVPLFSERIEELFRLSPSDPYLEDGAVRQNYALPKKIAYLSVFFIPFSDGRCRIIKEEVGEEIVKKYRTKVVCS